MTFGQQPTQQTQRTQPIIIDGDNVDYSSAREITAQGNVVVTYGDVRLTCDKIVVNNQTKDAEAIGNVRLQDPRGILNAEKLIYNFQTKTGEVLVGKFRSSPNYYFGDKIIRISEDEYIVKDGYFSTCNYDQPHFRMRSKTVRVFPDDKVIAHSNVLYWMKFPLFYLSRYSHRLKDPMRAYFKFGKDSDWGLYMLSVWRYYLNDDVRLRLYFDWRERWGIAEGFGVRYDTENIGRGDFKFYNTHERRTHDDQLEHQEFQRYFIRYRHMWDIDEDTKLTAQYYRVEDARRGWHSGANLLKDHFFREYEKESQPRTYALVNRTLPYSNISMLIRKRTNRHFGETEKMPEITYELNSPEIDERSIYLTHKTTFSVLNQKYATPSPNDMDVVRLDSNNKITLPIRFMFLQLSPYTGLRETIYSKNIRGDPITPRTNFYTGMDLSTKFYRIFNLNTNLLGLDINSLRHIITPTIEYAYIHEPTISNSALQQIDGIDSIAEDNRFTLALENKLQTKRAGGSTDLANLRISSNYIIHSKAAGISTGQDRFGSFLFDLELMPYAWLRMEADATYDHLNDYFSSVNVDNWIDFGNERSLGLGHRYVRKPEGGSPTSSEITSQLIWRINPKWKMRYYGRYQLTGAGSTIVGDYRRGMREQEFTVIRDIHCATIEIAVNKKKKVNAKTDQSIWFRLNLKAFKESEFDYAQSYRPPKTP